MCSMLANAYREPGGAERRPEAPTELSQKARSSTSHIVGFSIGLLLVGAMIGGARERFASTMAVTGIFVVVVALLLSLIADNGVVLSVVEDTVSLRRGRRRGKVILCLPLEELLDVKIDTAEMSPPPVTFSMTPGFGWGSQSASAYDESRIVFYPRAANPFPLTERYGSVTETTEWLAEIRQFLRAHGWLPLDERGEDVDSSGGHVEDVLPERSRILRNRDA